MVVFLLVYPAAAETQAERRASDLARYTSIDQATKDAWTAWYGSTICNGASLNAPSLLTHDILSGTPVNVDLKPLVNVIDVNGNPVPSEVWKYACHVYTEIMSPTLGSYADHIEVDLDLMVTLENSKYVAACSPSCNESIMVRLHYEDLSTLTEKTTDMTLAYSLSILSTLCDAFTVSMSSPLSLVVDQYVAAVRVPLGMTVTSGATPTPSSAVLGACMPTGGEQMFEIAPPSVGFGLKINSANNLDNV